MRLGILSDIHSNLEALKAVLKAFKAEKINTYVCLGDIIGYGADPLKCVDKIRKLTDLVIAGNHDHAALGITSIENFNHYAKLSTIWTSEQLKDKHKNYIEQLPLTIKQHEVLYVHSTPQNPEQWNYIISLEHARFAFATFDEKLCFIGHSHQPITFKQTGEAVELLPAGDIKLNSDSRYIINVGSVGQPRDGNPEACYCVYDVTEGMIETKRVAYDVEKAQNKIVRKELPEYLANRLGKGR